MKTFLIRLFLLSYAFSLPAVAFAQETLFIGTYTGPKSVGIYKASFDPKTGKIGDLSVAGKTSSPSFIALDPSRKLLFCVNEIGDFQGKKTGGVSSFKVDENKNLSLISQSSSFGTYPCHLYLHPDGKSLLAANYGGGSFCRIQIAKDGKLSESPEGIQFQGTGPDRSRQEAPHAHSALIAPDGKTALIADLGTDKIHLYNLEGKLAPSQPEALVLEPGSGPRHMAFHPSGKFLFVVNEMKSTVTAFRWNPSAGDFKRLLTVGTLPADFTGNNSTAEIIASADGKTVYASNRGHNSIAVFHFDPVKESLELKGHAAENINTPRNFTLHPSQKWLLVGNQGNNSIAVYKVNQDGSLTYHGLQKDIPTPVCLRFWPS